MIRQANGTDAPAIYTLICALEETVFPQEPFSAGLNALLKEPSHVLLVAEVDGKVVGLLHLRMEFQLHHCGTVAEIMELIVSDEVRSKEIGAELLGEARALALRNECVQFEVTSNQKRKNAHRFYQREGLEQTHVKLTESLS